MRTSKSSIWSGFWKRINSSNIVATTKIADVLRTKRRAHRKCLKLTMFATLPDPDLQEIGKEQAWQMLRAFPAVARYVAAPDRVLQRWSMGVLFCKRLSSWHCKAPLLRYTSHPHQFSRSICSSQYNRGRKMYPGKGFTVLPFILDRDAHWLHCAGDLEGIDSTCRCCKLCPACKFCFSKILCDLKRKRFLALSRQKQNIALLEKSLNPL